MSIEILRNRIADAVALTFGVELAVMPNTDLIRVSRKLEWGEHFPSRWVYLVPLPVEHGLIQITGKQLEHYRQVAVEMNAVALVIWHDDKLRTLLARDVRFDGSFPKLLRPSCFQTSLQETFDCFLRRSR